MRCVLRGGACIGGRCDRNRPDRCGSRRPAISGPERACARVCASVFQPFLIRPTVRCSASIRAQRRRPRFTCAEPTSEARHSAGLGRASPALRRSGVFGNVRAASGPLRFSMAGSGRIGAARGAPARFQRNGVEFMTAFWGTMACGVLAILYGIWAIQSVMSADAGSQKMQEISAATREGAQAYLKRQYTTIAVVGVIIFVVVGFLLGWLVAIGFAIGAVPAGAAGFIGMNVSVRANVRTAQAAIGSLSGGLDIAFKSRATTGLFVAGLALLGVTAYFAVLTGWLGQAPNDRTVVDAFVALGLGGRQS